MNMMKYKTTFFLMLFTLVQNTCKQNFPEVVPEDQSKKVDCPTIFRKDDMWYMTYFIFDGRDYETWLAKSNNLLDWKVQGKILAFTDSTDWDDDQKTGYPAIQDPTWEGSYELNRFNGKYWMSYFGGSSRGKERGLLSADMAFTDKDPTAVHQWQRLESPIFMATDSNARWWENNTIYKTWVLLDESKTTTYPFVMFYFGAFWPTRKDADAFNRFACSYDLVYWAEWEGANLIAPSEPYDNWFAHKSCVIKHNGIVYHFYCAVNNKEQDRGIAVATSKDIGKSDLRFNEVVIPAKAGI